MDSFKVIIMVMLFYSVSITLITYSMPASALDYVDSFSDLDSRIDLNTTGQQLEESLQRQTNIPLVDLGAMVFYSGNILIDLLANFAFAIPQMLTLLMYGVFSIIGIDANFYFIIQVFASVAVLAWYTISLIQLITNARTGRVI